MAIIAAVGITVAVVVGSEPKAPDTFQLAGTMTLTESVTRYGGGPGFECVGYKGYDDMTQATAVTVSDESGTLLAKGTFAGSTGGSASSYPCVFTFVIDAVPTGKNFYKVEVSHRGALSYTQDEAQAGVALSLG
ncbi:hypothetical protein [Rhodococcoides fascians]|uniref:hypothetical protein n=1 Tax=Rhodococcoides fascians TaxID=1828 RepID=UPI00366E3773